MIPAPEEWARGPADGLPSALLPCRAHVLRWYPKEGYRMGKRLALCIFVMALAGCSGAQQSANAIPQIPATLTQASHSQSWMLPEAKNDDLLYLSSSASDVYVFSYPQAKEVGILTGLGGEDAVVGLCSDQNGNVWIPDYTDTISEYAHGGSKPVRVLHDPNVFALACSVDPTTGNLAVVGNASDGQSGSLVVYTAAKGAPHAYDISFPLPVSCAYDDTGNLFVDGNGQGNVPPFELGELAKGQTVFQTRTSAPVAQAGPMQWDGKHLVIGDRFREDVHRFSIRKNRIVDVDSFILDQIKGIVGLWIQGSRIVVTNGTGLHDSTQLYHYPAGGGPIKDFTLTKRIGDFGAGGVTISLAPK
jgi:hypothetical protein